MKQTLRTLYRITQLLGLDPLRFFTTLRNLPRFLADLWKLRRQRRSAAMVTPFGRCYPILGERSLEGGSARGHYFHQDLLVARRIFANNPASHFDVGSRIDGFVAHVAAFRTIDVIDIRPLAHQVTNLRFRQADMMAPVPEALVNSTDSLSCLHALEHFGLGRYGDPVDFDGFLKGFDALHRMLKKDGTLYLSVPIGPQRIEFNAHRVLSLRFLTELIGRHYIVQHFSYVDDEGSLHEDVPMPQDKVDNNFGCHYGCGIFELRKL